LTCLSLLWRLFSGNLQEEYLIKWAVLRYRLAIDNEGAGVAVRVATSNPDNEIYYKFKAILGHLLVKLKLRRSATVVKTYLNTYSKMCLRHVLGMS
jgi:hypothetical protein